MDVSCICSFEGASPSYKWIQGISSMVEHRSPKPSIGVRIPYPLDKAAADRSRCCSFCYAGNFFDFLWHFWKISGIINISTCSLLSSMKLCWVSCTFFCRTVGYTVEYLLLQPGRKAVLQLIYDDGKSAKRAFHCSWQWKVCKACFPLFMTAEWSAVTLWQEVRNVKG